MSEQEQLYNIYIDIYWSSQRAQLYIYFTNFTKHIHESRQGEKSKAGRHSASCTEEGVSEPRERYMAVLWVGRFRYGKTPNWV